MCSTRLIDNELFNESSKLIEKNTKNNSCNALIRLQFAYLIINTLAKTAYSNATLITDLAGLEACFLGMSSIGMGISLPLSILFALSEAYAHYAESEHFNHAEDDLGDIETGVNQQSDQSSLSVKQKAAAGIHYVSDILEGASVPLLFSKLGGIDAAPFWVKALTYAGVGLYSSLGNAQELKNAVIAFRQENKRK